MNLTKKKKMGGGRKTWTSLRSKKRREKKHKKGKTLAKGGNNPEKPFHSAGTNGERSKQNKAGNIQNRRKKATSKEHGNARIVETITGVEKEGGRMIKTKGKNWSG